MYLHGEKPACITWFVIAGIGVFLASVFGEFRFLYFMRKMEKQLLLMKQLTMFLTYSVNMVQMYGLNGKLRTYYRKALPILEVRMAYLQKKQILWTYGLTLVPLIRLFCMKEAISSDLPIFTWKVLTNTVAGLTLRFQQL